MNETRLERVVQMEQQVHDYILEESVISSALDDTMEYLYSRQQEAQRRSIPAERVAWNTRVPSTAVNVTECNFLQHTQTRSRQFLKDSSASSKFSNATFRGIPRSTIQALNVEIMDTISIDDDDGLKDEDNASRQEC